MCFIGIVTDTKSEGNLKKMLKKNNILNKNKIIFIRENNINNIKSICFDTIVINKKFNKVDELNQILSNCKNLIINIDIELDKLNVVNANVITYGFNSKSTITISSILEDEVLLCIQRNINSNYGKIEIQEFKIETEEVHNVYDLIIIATLFLMYISSKNLIHINGIK